MYPKVKICIILITLLCFSEIEGRPARWKPKVATIIVYENENFNEGEIGEWAKLLVPYDRCFGMNEKWNNRISSIDPDINCVIVYPDFECKKPGVRLEKYSFGTLKLGDIGLNDGVSGMKAC